MYTLNKMNKIEPLIKMNKEYLIKKTSKIEQTFEDEFKADFNSPECIWDNFLENELWGLLEFTRQNYYALVDDWVRKSDGRIISSGDIMNDYTKSLTE